jgi:hypothetical protein
MSLAHRWPSRSPQHRAGAERGVSEAGRPRTSSETVPFDDACPDLGARRVVHVQSGPFSFTATRSAKPSRVAQAKHAGSCASLGWIMIICEGFVRVQACVSKSFGELAQRSRYRQDRANDWSNLSWTKSPEWCGYSCYHERGRRASEKKAVAFGRRAKTRESGEGDLGGGA